MSIRIATEKEYKAHIKQRERQREEKREQRAQIADARRKRHQEATEKARIERKEVYAKLRAGGYRITPRLKNMAGRAMRVQVKIYKKKKRKGKKIKGKKIWKKIRKIKLI